MHTHTCLYIGRMPCMHALHTSEYTHTSSLTHIIYLFTHPRLCVWAGVSLPKPPAAGAAAAPIKPRNQPTDFSRSIDRSDPTNHSSFPLAAAAAAAAAARAWGERR
jgi:hypothetical protein